MDMALVVSAEAEREAVATAEVMREEVAGEVAGPVVVGPEAAARAEAEKVVVD